MIKLDILPTPLKKLLVAPVGEPWVKENLEPLPSRNKAWRWSASHGEIADLSVLVNAKVKAFNERFHEALDNMIVLAVEQGLDLAVSDWIRDDTNKSYRREFALLTPGETTLPFPAPVRIYHTSKGWPEGRDPRKSGTNP